MTRLTLAALALLASINAAAAMPLIWTPSEWPEPGSFDGPAIVSQDDRDK